MQLPLTFGEILQNAVDFSVQHESCKSVTKIIGGYQHSAVSITHSSVTDTPCSIPRGIQCIAVTVPKISGDLDSAAHHVHLSIT